MTRPWSEIALGLILVLAFGLACFCAGRLARIWWNKRASAPAGERAGPERNEPETGS